MRNDAPLRKVEELYREDRSKGGDFRARLECGHSISTVWRRQTTVGKRVRCIQCIPKPAPPPPIHDLITWYDVSKAHALKRFTELNQSILDQSEGKARGLAAGVTVSSILYGHGSLTTDLEREAEHYHALDGLSRYIDRLRPLDETLQEGRTVECELPQ